MRPLLALPIALLLTAAFSLGVSVAPAHADENESPVSWSVEPATAEGTPQDQPWLELTLDPGVSVEEHMLITNHSSKDVQFALSAADGYFTDAGRFNMLRADQESVDAGTWIAIQNSITVPADNSVVVPFTLTVPTNATPGDHPAGVAAGVLTHSDSVQVESRIGFRVMTRVTGDLTPAVTSQVITTYHPSWNPFLPGSVDVTHTITNTGNIRVSLTGDVTVAGIGGLALTKSPIPPSPEIAPGEKHTTTVAIDGVWPLLATTATVDSVAIPVEMSTEPLRSSASETAPTIPWPQLVLVLLAAAVIFLTRTNHRRRRKTLENQLKAAREQGRKEASRSMLATAITVGVLLSLMPAAAPAAFADDQVSIIVNISPQPNATPTPGTRDNEISWLPATGGGEPTRVFAFGMGLLVLGGTFAIALHSERTRRCSPRREM